jgi:hypothetical protein
MRRPIRATIFSIVRRRWASSLNRPSTCCSLPLRSIQMSWAPLTMTSVMSGSRRNGSIGP